jgi:signal transduction histidine kinase
LRRPRFWPDRLGGQVALLLFGALLLEFVGSEWLFNRAETGVLASERASQLAQQIGVADRLMSEIPAARREAVAADLWRGPLVLAWQPGAPATVGTHKGPALVDRAFQVIRPELDGRTIRLSVAGTSLMGAWQLGDGSWMTLRATGYLDTSRQLHSHIGAVLMLVACVTILALVLARLLGRPLRKLADAADRVGREEATPVVEEGPREVRRVAAAFNAMQARLLDQVNERIQALAAVSHDLRTPIARLRLRAASVRDRELRAAIGHDLDEMEAFMRSLLDFLRGADPEDERLIDLASLIVTIVHDAQDMGSNVHYDGPTNLELVTRPIKLHRAIDNLVQNAVRHAGHAEVHLSRDGDGVHITIQDRGPGIPADQLEMVFEPFRRLESSRNRNTGGAGLGLAIVRRSITRLGGMICLENRSGGGLRAAITLPSAADGDRQTEAG